MFSFTWGNPEVGGGDNLLGSEVKPSRLWAPRFNPGEAAEPQELHWQNGYLAPRVPGRFPAGSLRSRLNCAVLKPL